MATSEADGGAPLRARVAAWSAAPLQHSDRAAAMLGGLVALTLLYHVVGARTAASAITYSLPSPVDRWIPFTPAASLVYGFLYAHVLVPAFLIEDRRALLRGGMAYLGLVLAGVPFWLLWPVSVPRTPLPVTDTFSWGVAVIRWIDPPTNCFPSMHVAEAFLAALLTRRMDRAAGGVMLVSALVIWWSTIALRQHWFVDGLAGLALALSFDYLTFGWRALPTAALQPGPRRRLMWMLALYAALFLGFALPWWLGWADASDLPARW